MRILIASSIDPQKIEQLKQEHDVICAFNAKEDVLKSQIKDREILIFRSGVTISAAVMESAPGLKLLIRAGSGTDNIDMDYVAKRGLTLIRVPQPGAKAVAEMAFGMMIGLARNIVRADSLLRRGRWAKSEMTGYLLNGKTLGIVGCGNIGTRVGRMGVAWEMNAIGCVDHLTPARADDQMAHNHIRFTDFAEVVSKADFLSIHVPKKPSTLNMINKNVFDMMKDGAFLVNLARGGVVNEQDLLAALNSGKLRGAALDVHENEGEGKISPLADLPNVILTPHIGAQAVDAQREIGERIQRILDDYSTGTLNPKAHVA